MEDRVGAHKSFRSGLDLEGESLLARTNACKGGGMVTKSQYLKITKKFLDDLKKI